jgi:hypothetical protein
MIACEVRVPPFERGLNGFGIVAKERGSVEAAGRKPASFFYLTYCNTFILPFFFSEFKSSSLRGFRGRLLMQPVLTRKSPNSQLIRI